MGTVLIVDDDAAFCELAGMWLRDDGYDVVTATSPAQARQALRSRRVSVCLLDLDLGHHSGLRLARELGEVAPDVALVTMSGSDDAAVVEQALALGVYGYLLKPFWAGELAIAVRNALHRRHSEQECRDLHRRLESAVENRTLELALSREETIQRLARAIEFRDSSTARHVERMSELCWMLARRVGFAAEEAALISTASLLHDVGKLAIPDRILSKRDRLEADEWETMKAHTILGHQLLSGSRSELIELAATIALTHHERTDGSGYPNGLCNGEIPEAGRIAAVCDVFDALTSPRPYRHRPFTVHEAVRIMRAEGDGAFDHEILDALLGYVDEDGRARSRKAALVSAA